MSDIITRNPASVEQNWLKELGSALSDPSELLKELQLDPTPWQNGFGAKRQFAQRVPLSFVKRMEVGNPHDPLLRQVLPVIEEFEETAGYSTDPLEEQDNAIPGLLHKYQDRVLMILKGGCAVNCRYCFRRHFPYQDNPSGRQHWQKALDYIRTHTELNEVIFSGGDPLMTQDGQLKWLLDELATIPHLKRLRFHSRLPVVIPNRITPELCELFAHSPLPIVLVTHINHANEINDEFRQAMRKLQDVRVTLLNQSVLLKDVNNNAEALVNLSEALFSAGILPYYLHVLDKVQGAAHFFVSDDDAKALVGELLSRLSGYLVPKLAREIAGRGSKTPLDLHLE